MNFVHNDLKLENILIGRDDPNQIYLIDFGLAHRWKDPITNRHISKVRMEEFFGNLRFATKSQCRGYCTSRGDDIKSAIYILIYLLNKTNLPWLKPDAGLNKYEDSAEWL